MWHDIRTRIHEDCFMDSKITSNIVEDTYRYTHRQQGVLIRLFLFFQIMKVG
jgi:hypothetical protein